MPLPLILGVGAAIAGVAGVGTGIHGAVKMKDANDTMKLSQSIHEENINHFEKQNKTTTNDMDSLGKKELEVLNSFKEFSDIFEKIHNKPEFKEFQHDGVKIPAYNPEEIKKVSVGAGVLLGGLGGAALGTAGGFAAAGATTAAVMALGTASTGTAIASLSGVAATNATLAALGGGAIAAGGGGMALGSAVLGAATLGVGLMVGGIVFSVTGSSLSSKADEAYYQVKKEREQVNTICEYLSELSTVAKDYEESITTVYNIYQKQLTVLSYVVNTLKKTDWNIFTPDEQIVTENTVLLVTLLYNMSKVELVLKSEDSEELNKINKDAIEKSKTDAKIVLIQNGLSENELILDWSEVKKLVRKRTSDEDYYRWIHPLKANITKDSIQIIALYRDAASYVKTNFNKVIESSIKQLIQRDITISYGVIENKQN